MQHDIIKTIFHWENSLLVSCYICSAQVKLHWCQPSLGRTPGDEVSGVWRSEIIFPLTAEWGSVRDTSCGNQGDVACLPACLSIDLPVYLLLYSPACLLAFVSVRSAVCHSCRSKEMMNITEAGHGFHCFFLIIFSTFHVPKRPNTASNLLSNYIQTIIIWAEMYKVWQIEPIER